MWCLLCKKMFNDPEAFSIHIMKKHRLSSQFQDKNSDSEDSKHSETNVSELDKKTDSCRASNPDINAVIPRMKTRVKTKIYKFTSKSNSQIKTRSKLSTKSYLTRSKPINKRKKLNVLKRISKQLTSYNFLRSQSVSQPVLSVSCLNEPKQLPLLDKAEFEFNSQNIYLWLQKLKQICKKTSLPLEPKILNKVNTILKEIFENYFRAPSNEVSSAVLKVYKELDYMVGRHVMCMNESLVR